MAVPRNRHSNARKHSKRAHSAMKPQKLVQCPSCGEQRQSHCACTKCGHYRGRDYFGSEENA